MVRVVTGQAYGETVSELGFVGQPPLAYERRSCVEHPVGFFVVLQSIRLELGWLTSEGVGGRWSGAS